MIKEARGFGATTDEARENALKELNASEFDDIQFEVITTSKKKILGIFGGRDAEVRAFIEIPDKEKKAKPVKKAKPQKDVKAEKPVKAEKKADVAEKANEVKPEPKPEKAEPSPYSEPVDASEIAEDSPVGKAIAYIKTIVNSLNCGEISIKVASRENGSLIMLDGDDLNIIIGRRGETLDALQYLASLVANNGGGHYKISLNIGNYREKREETLTNLAKRVSAQALKTGKCRTLEPMNPYERRIIHTAVQEIEGVVSGSFGEGAGRRVVIAPEGVELKPRRSDDRRRGGRSGASRQNQAAPAAPNREPKKDSDIPLYGKIN